MASIGLVRGRMGRRELRPATLRARLAATFINLVATLTAIALALSAGVLGYRRLRGRSNGRDGPLRAISDDPRTEPIPPRRWPHRRRATNALQTRPIKLGLRLLSVALMLRRAESRSLGYRVLGLRLADVRSGGDPTRRQRLVREITQQLWMALHRRLLPIQTPPGTPDQEILQAEIAAVRREHAGDQAALQQALMRVYRVHKVDPVRATCLPLLARLPLMAAINIPMPWSPLARSSVDWLSGTVVVVDRRPRRDPTRHRRGAIGRL